MLYSTISLCCCCWLSSSTAISLWLSLAICLLIIWTSSYTERPLSALQQREGKAQRHVLGGRPTCPPSWRWCPRPRWRPAPWPWPRPPPRPRDHCPPCPGGAACWAQSHSQPRPTLWIWTRRHFVTTFHIWLSSYPFRNMSQFHGVVLQWMSYFICSSTDRRFVSLLTWSYFILTFDMLMCPRCLGDSDHLAIDQTPQGWVLSGVCAGQLFNNPTHHRTAGHQSPPATVSTLIGNQWGNTTQSLGRAGCTMKHETSAIFHSS